MRRPSLLSLKERRKWRESSKDDEPTGKVESSKSSKSETGSGMKNFENSENSEGSENKLEILTRNFKGVYQTWVRHNLLL